MNAHQARVDELFEAGSEFWSYVYSSSDVFGQIHQERLRIAVGWVDTLRLAPGTPVLDAGAGAGVTTVALARRGLAVTAIDPTDAMVSKTRARAAAAGVEGTITAQKSDIHELPFGDQTFEAIVSLGVVPWLHSPKRALTELARVLRPGGWLIVNCDNRARLHWLLDPWFWPPVASLRRILSETSAPSSQRPVRAQTQFRRQFEQMVTETDLQPLEGQMFGFGPFTLAGRKALPDGMGRWADRWLTRLAEADVPVLRSTGSQYIVLCRRPPIK